MSDPSTTFSEISTRWLDGWLARHPVAATQIGRHDHDHLVDDFSAEARQDRVEFSRAVLEDLTTLPSDELSLDDQVDAAILANRLRHDIWHVEILQAWAWDPQEYNEVAGGALYGLLAREFSPLPSRLRSAAARMERLPGLFAQARENLDPARVPRIHAETVARQHGGVASLTGEVLGQASALDGGDRDRLEQAGHLLREALAVHQVWLDDVLVPNASGDFRIGQDLYDARLAFALHSQLSRQEIRDRAQSAIVQTRAEMHRIARTVLPRDFEGDEQATIEAALELAYADRPARDEVVRLAEEATRAATEFARARDLVRVPDHPVQVIEMPEFQRGVAGAYCDSPGPLEQGLDTFYAVEPIPDDWTDEQVESYLREYNTRSMHELSIHEAVPGHYLQLAHAHRHPSVLRAVLESGSFIEGWAMYAEKVMADAGYLDGDPLMQLIQRKWALRAMANAVLDQAVHVDGISREDAMELMTVTTFQQEREAAGKWVRAQLTSTQLPTYFVGYLEHLDLRAEAEARAGTAFSLRGYHDDLLTHGSPPVRLARSLLLGEPVSR